MSTPEQRAHWRRLEQAATPGEWTVEVEEYGNSGSITIPAIERLLHHTEWADPEDFQRDTDNAEFIASARTAVPALLEDVERLEAKYAQLLAELREALLEIAGTPPEELWQMADDRMKYMEIQVDKKDYAAARKRLEELEERA